MHKPTKPLTLYNEASASIHNNDKNTDIEHTHIDIINRAEALSIDKQKIEKKKNSVQTV